MGTATITLSATNTPDVFVVTPQTRPAEDIDVRNDKRVNYWYCGPFRDELVGTHERMVSLMDHPLYQDGWWERKTEVTTTVIERL